MHNKIFEFARDIAIRAGKIQLKGFRSKDLIISYKSRTNLLTNIDKASEEYIYDNIRKKFPDHTIRAEEGSRKEAAGDYIWHVDPLDGTNNYAHGLPFFCVSIGVFSKKLNRIVVGIVYNPYHKEMFTAVTGKGAYLNKEKIFVSNIDDIGISMLATGFPYDKEDPEKNNLKYFNRILPRIQGIRRMGSAALDLSYVACGRLDGYWEGSLNAWDIAAGSLIVEEAGGRISKYKGEPFNIESSEIIASNGRIHDRMIQILNDRNS